ncbi:hypothetical protein K440DRAFT_555844 [Wilcoxina mikolae CBS 423.85]|nr:hypothetical protein K440DRAFT_555844 [Wilcoxina mikolae CBS 423.85]
MSDHVDVPPNLYNGIHEIPWDRLEDPAMYKPGGYHPLKLGDELHNGRYRIIHRLGHGRYSTVWLALDQRCERASTAVSDIPVSRYVAIKIGIANNEKDETAILCQLQAQPQANAATLPSPSARHSRPVSGCRGRRESLWRLNFS